MNYYQFTVGEKSIINSIVKAINNDVETEPQASLYRYMKLCDENINNILENKTHVTAAKEMPDKLDFSYPVSIAPKDIENALRYYLKKITTTSPPREELIKHAIIQYEKYANETDALSVKQNFHIACFTTSCLNDFMWDRYADKCRGICCEYPTTNELLKTNLFKVIYADKNAVENCLNVRKDKSTIGNERINILDLLYGIRKNPCWRHEDEYRLIVPFLSGENHIVIEGFKPKSITLGRDWYEYEKDKKKAAMYKKVFEYCYKTKTKLYVLIANYKTLRYERCRII